MNLIDCLDNLEAEFLNWQEPQDILPEPYSWLISDDLYAKRPSSRKLNKEILK